MRAARTTGRAGGFRSRRGLLALGRFCLLLYLLAFYIGSAHRTVGHQKDFLAQWTLANLATTGIAEEIYDPDAQERVARANLPPEVYVEEQWFIEGVGISPYPPIMVLLYWPLGLLPVVTAQWVIAELSVLFAVVAAWSIAACTDRRVGVSTALTAILLYPGFFYSFALGQNAFATLALASLGWWALCRSNGLACGTSWALLAYKPHWIAAFGWLPAALSVRSSASADASIPRQEMAPEPASLSGSAVLHTYLAMCATLMSLALMATLSFGPEIWFAWWERVQAFSTFYTGEPQQLDMAVDLRAMAWRFLPDSIALPVGWLALSAVALISCLRYWRVARDRPSGPTSLAATVLVCAACLISPYSMYYDASVFLLPVLLLWSHRSGMSSPERRVLGMLTAGFYLAMLIHGNWPGGWQAPSIQTIVCLALWCFSLWVAGNRPDTIPVEERAHDRRSRKATG